MTSPFDALVACLVAGMLNAGILVVLGSNRRITEPVFVGRVYLATLFLRAVMAVALNVYAGDRGVTGMFWGDSATYDIAGDQLARRWHGDAASTGLTEALSGYGFVYCVGAVYFVFGRNQLLVQLLNATIGSLTVLVVYAIARRLFGAEVARWSALFMAFFPQMLFWSAGMYKDSAVLFLLAVSMFAVVGLRDAFSPGMLTLLCGAGIGLLTLRFYIFYFVGLAALATFVFGRRGALVPRIASYAVTLGVFAFVVTFAVKEETRAAQRAFMTLEQVQITRADQAMWGQSAYGTQYDVSTPGGALAALPLGLAYLLFAPFPWSITGVRQLLTLPEMLAWYALMPAFARGLTFSVRHLLRETLPILVFTVTLTIAYALMQGNVGTAYRQRTQITMFFFVFMAAGIVERRRGT